MRCRQIDEISTTVRCGSSTDAHPIGTSAHMNVVTPVKIQFSGPVRVRARGSVCHNSLPGPAFGSSAAISSGSISAMNHR